MFTLAYKLPDRQQDATELIDLDRAVDWMSHTNKSTPILPFGDASNYDFSPNGKQLALASMKY